MFFIEVNFHNLDGSFVCGNGIKVLKSVCGGVYNKYLTSFWPFLVTPNRPDDFAALDIEYTNEAPVTTTHKSG